MAPGFECIDMFAREDICLIYAERGGAWAGAEALRQSLVGRNSDPRPDSMEMQPRQVSASM